MAFSLYDATMQAFVLHKIAFQRILQMALRDNFSWSFSGRHISPLVFFGFLLTYPALLFAVFYIMEVSRLPRRLFNKDFAADRPGRILFVSGSFRSEAHDGGYQGSGGQRDVQPGPICPSDGVLWNFVSTDIGRKID